MPSREDEFYSGNNTERGQALCPFCGSTYVYPIKEKRFFFFTHIVAWSCGNEEMPHDRRQFPAPVGVPAPDVDDYRETKCPKLPFSQFLMAFVAVISSLWRLCCP
jgi:hypothetical protein